MKSYHSDLGGRSKQDSAIRWWYNQAPPKIGHPSDADCQILNESLCGGGGGSGGAWIYGRIEKEEHMSKYLSLYYNSYPLLYDTYMVKILSPLFEVTRLWKV